MHSEYTIYNVFKSMQRKKKDLKLENDSPFTCTKNENHELHGKEKCYDLR